MALDLTSFTEVDPGSDIVVTANKVDWTTMIRSAQSYVYKDFGVGYFGDFVIEWEAAIPTFDINGLTAVFGLSNTIGTWNDHDTAGDGFTVAPQRSSPNSFIYLTDWTIPGGDTEARAWSALALTYFRFTRVGSVATLYIYSDSSRTVLLDTLVINPCSTNAYRYLYALMNKGDNTQNTTGYTQSFEIIESNASLGVMKSAIFGGLIVR